MEPTTLQSNTELTLPESIILGGITYSLQETPELKSLVSIVSKVEKRKLYSQIAAVKEQVAQLEKVNVEPDASFKQDILNEVKSVIANALKPLLDKTNQIQTSSVEEYRQKLINENLDKCIPELVKGSNKEEIDESLKQSIALRAKYPSANVPFQDPNQKVTDPIISQQTQQLNGNGQKPATNIAASPTPIQQPVNVPRISVTEPVQTDISKMSQEEFAKKRESLQEQIKTLV